ncbi:hypothetical protein T265_10308 [Opisthorchis viverrini]|uniref:Uncharacterized protein n=1 Tax=Opisthorchis viverrini TaxID=6198 RepID=A0A074ZDR3_OPIVI|nr:hypothetical protein T265_10308 [Opisthorchis viverrini]KER21335.1 hypothetical protein T265_10308 [Opisthorchis viverrini]
MSFKRTHQKNRLSNWATCFPSTLTYSPSPHIMRRQRAEHSISYRPIPRPPLFLTGHITLMGSRRLPDWKPTYRGAKDPPQGPGGAYTGCGQKRSLEDELDLREGDYLLNTSSLTMHRVVPPND